MVSKIKSAFAPLNDSICCPWNLLFLSENGAVWGPVWGKAVEQKHSDENVRQLMVTAHAREARTDLLSCFLLALSSHHITSSCALICMYCSLEMRNLGSDTLGGKEPLFFSRKRLCSKPFCVFYYVCKSIEEGNKAPTCCSRGTLPVCHCPCWWWGWQQFRKSSEHLWSLAFCRSLADPTESSLWCLQESGHPSALKLWAPRASPGQGGG